MIGWDTESLPVGTHGYSRSLIGGKQGAIVLTFTKIEEDLWYVDGDKYKNAYMKKILDNETVVSVVVGVIDVS